MAVKLANVLADRAHLQRRLSELEQRLNNNAKVQAGEAPAENPNDLLAELDSVLHTLEELIAKINLINSTTTINGMTLTELLARRDCLKMRLRIMRGFLNNASQKVTRSTKSELAVKSTVSVADLQKEVDRFSKELRIVDDQIQELNWTTDL